MRKEQTVLVFLSHDVDWGKEGAPKYHILARKDRFDEDTLKQMDKKNPYQNISEILDIEEGYGLRSTFFFRASSVSSHPPPPYDLEDYKSDIRGMLSSGWEVGLHSDILSHNNLHRLEQEKARLEEISNAKVHGNRTHYTISETLHGALLRNLKRLGFRYDSSVKYERELITKRDLGFFEYEGMKVFPITLMDTLIFHNIETENDVLKTIEHAVGICEKMTFRRIMTLTWHNCSLKMKFGRKYRDVLDFLVSKRNVLVKTGLVLSDMIDAGEIQGS